MTTPFTPPFAAGQTDNRDSLTVWVAIDDFGDGVPAGGPFDSYDECSEWIGFDDRYEPREMPRDEALAGLAETQRLANQRYRDSLTATDPVDARIADLALDRLILRVARVFSADAVNQILDDLEPKRLVQCPCTDQAACDCDGRPLKDCPCYSDSVHQYGEVAS